MTTPNPLYLKGSSYTLEEFIPVIRAAQKMGLTDSDSLWFKDVSGYGRSRAIDITCEPYTLLQDIQAPYDAPKPLTVEEMRKAYLQETDPAYYWNPEKNQVDFTYNLGDLACLNIPCYATEDDCNRAHGLEVV